MITLAGCALRLHCLGVGPAHRAHLDRLWADVAAYFRATAPASASSVMQRETGAAKVSVVQYLGPVILP